MEPHVIAAHLACPAEGLPRAQAERIAASLGLASGKPAALDRHGQCWLAASGRPARGWQSTRTSDGRRVLFTGHLENRQEVAARLGLSPSAGDERLYCAGLETWGDRVDLELIGQFATIVATPDGRSLRLCRSPLIAPPIHYARFGGGVMAASVARALHATGEIERQMDPQKFDHALLLDFCDEERSWFTGIRRLPAGHRLILAPGRESERPACYYTLADAPKVRLARDEDYVEQARALFDQAVRGSLDGYSRPGISLSGGLDSQAVAASVLLQFPDRALRGFTSIPEPGWDGRLRADRFGDERDKVEALRARYPSLSVEWIDAAGLWFDHHEQAMFMLGGLAPLNTGNMHWSHEVYRRARTSGCDLLLGGDSGNGSFSFNGSGARTGWLVSGEWRRLWCELAHSRGDHSRPFALLSQALLPLLPRRLRLALAERKGMATADRYAGWCPLDPAYVARSGLEERSRAQGFDPDFLGPWNSRQWRVEFFSQGEAESADMQQALCELHQIPFRDPCASRPLVEFCLGIPDHQYLRDGVTRWLARRMLVGRVPDAVVTERRTGRQSADWIVRLRRQREQLLSELRAMEEDPFLAERIDLAGLREALEHLPDETPLDSPAGFRLQLALPRAVSTARFYRHVSGRNR